jgi:excisionase family DNA binding protein
MSELRIADDDRPFYSQQSLAAKLRISDRMVRKLIETRQIRAYKVGRATRIAPEDVDSYLASRCLDRAA